MAAPRRRSDAVTVALLRSRLHFLISRRVCAITYTGRRSGREVTLPVEYVQTIGHLVVPVGHSDRKRWWRNFEKPRPVRVQVRGAEIAGTARAFRAGSPGHAEASQAYSKLRPRNLNHDDPFVVISLEQIPQAAAAPAFGFGLRAPDTGGALLAEGSRAEPRVAR
jgi:hypothetical protein